MHRRRRRPRWHRNPTKPPPPPRRKPRCPSQEEALREREANRKKADMEYAQQIADKEPAKLVAALIQHWMNNNVDSESGTRKSAILLMALGEDRAAATRCTSCRRTSEVQALGLAMSKLTLGLQAEEVWPPCCRSSARKPSSCRPCTWARPATSARC
jgi:hypothetical protein